MILRTEAVPLRRIEYGETSLIVTLYTREMGKLTVMAKGARSPGSRFGSTLQPMSHVHAVLYYKPSREIQVLSECAHLRPFHKLFGNIDRISAGLRAVELLNAVMHEQEQNGHAFQLLVDTLQKLNESSGKEAQVLCHFRLRLGSILGFAPHINREDVENIPAEGGMLRLDTGAVGGQPAGPAGASMRASRSALRAFAIFASTELETALRMNLTREVAREVSDLIDGFLRHHVPDHYPSRASRVIAQMDDRR